VRETQTLRLFLAGPSTPRGPNRAYARLRVRTLSVRSPRAGLCDVTPRDNRPPLGWLYPRVAGVCVQLPGGAD